MLAANAHLPTTNIQRDLNSTCMSTVYNLIQCSLRSKCPLPTYKAMHPSVIGTFMWRWKQYFALARTMLFICYIKNKLNAAFGPLVRRYAHKKFTSERLSIGNEGKKIFDNMIMIDMLEMKLSDREEVCLVLDKSTVGREVTVDREKWKDTTKKYKEAYVNFVCPRKLLKGRRRGNKHANVR